MSITALALIALAEDLGEAGDVTSATTVPADLSATAALVAREPGVAAGLDAVVAVLAEVDPTAQLTGSVPDGTRLAAGTVLGTLRGGARSLLAAERTALNVLGHACGVATATRRYVDAVAGTGCRVRDTRKTLPGLRAVAKAAVVAGGGTNHRRGLFDGLLVKDNHVAAAGGIVPATRAALAGSQGLPVQVEVDDLDELDEALAAGAPTVLLDNFGLEDLRVAAGRCREAGVFCEASGGITLDTVRAVAETGVDAVAVGALTHSVTALDVGLDWQGA